MNVTAKSPACLMLSCCVAAIALVGCGASVDREERVDVADEALTENVCPDNVPANLTPSADQKLWFVLAAEGVQIYRCAATATGYAWAFVAPRADLLDAGGEVVGFHDAGPTWHADDGSSIRAARIDGAPSPEGAIPWLLLGAVAHSGDGKMANVTGIQRLDTSGGVAPSSGCDADQVGAIAEVPYTADYFFYKQGEGTRCGE